VIDFIVEMAKVTDRPISPDELMKLANEEEEKAA